jgi:hypothetical protein
MSGARLRAGGVAEQPGDRSGLIFAFVAQCPRLTKKSGRCCQRPFNRGLERGSALHHLHRPVIIAVVAVRMMEPAVHEVIGVITVRDSLMSAARTVNMPALVRGGRLATIRIGGVHRQRVLVVMPVMRVMQMAVVQEINMAVVLDGGVTATGSVLVIVIRVGVMMLGHGALRFV